MISELFIDKHIRTKQLTSTIEINYGRYDKLMKLSDCKECYMCVNAGESHINNKKIVQFFREKRKLFIRYRKC